MKKAEIYLHNRLVGILEETESGFQFIYIERYQGAPISLTMPIRQQIYHYKRFPPFFEGLLPEGAQLDALLRTEKLDSHDYLGQLITVGGDLVGAVTVKEGE